MSAFWAPLLEDGTPDGSWEDWSSESELREERICYDCGREFIEGDEQQEDLES